MVQRVSWFWLGLLTTLGLCAMGYGLWARAVTHQARARLQPRREAEDAPPPPQQRPLLLEVRWLAPALAVLAALGLLFAGLDPALSVAIAAMFGVLCGLALESWRGGRRAQLEAQLAEAIDLMVGALRAGSALSDSLGVVAREVPAPMGDLVADLLGRIRWGEDPREALATVGERVDLETFELWVTTLSVQWEVGGSLAQTLASVGQTIRERNELTRRVRAQSTQARASVVGILGVCYLIGLGSWLSDPGRVEGFLSTQVGLFLVAGTIALQAVGLGWIARMSRIEV